MLIFSFDPGTNSAGWAAFEIQDGQKAARLVDAGVRIFGERRTIQSRREKNLLKRHRIRRQKRLRQQRLVSLLIETGLLPEDEAERKKLFDRDPYELRMRGLTKPLTRHELGRAICHIAKRCGWADYQSDNSIPHTAHGFPTWGAWLWTRHEGPAHKRLPVRNHLGSSPAIEVDFAPPRRALEHEFNTLWERQFLLLGQSIACGVQKRIRDILFPGSQATSPAGSIGETTPAPQSNLTRIAINQTTRLIKSMASVFGSPDIVVVEKPFISPEKALDIRHAATDSASRSLTGGSAKRRLKLLKRQQQAAGGHAFCPYTGTPLDKAFVLSANVQVDHIVPIRHGGNEEPDNLILCMADANRFKAGRTPFEAFGPDRNWTDIVARLHRLPAGNKRQIQRRNVPDTAYNTGFNRHQEHSMLQITKGFAQVIRDRFPAAEIDWVHPQASARMRKHHRLAECLADGNDTAAAKNRLDHRHHAVDAIAAGLAILPAHFDDIDVSALACQADRILKRMTVSTRLNHSKSGPMHKQTVYGCAGKDNALVVYRKQLPDLSGSEIRSIRDRELRDKIECMTRGASPMERRRRLTGYSAKTGTRRVRLRKKLTTGIRLADKLTGKISRVVQPAGNHHIDIIKDRAGCWQLFGTSTHEVRQPGWRPAWETAGCGHKLVMRLHKADTVEIDGADGTRVLRRVVRLAPSSGHVYLSEPNAAGNLAKRHADQDDPFRWEMLNAEMLRRRGAKAVRIDVLGRCFYRKSNV